MMPAMCVPCPYRSRPSPPRKSFVAITRPRSAACVVSIPESMTATVMPAPVSPFTASEPAHTWSAPMLSAVTASLDWIRTFPDR